MKEEEECTGSFIAPVESCTTRWCACLFSLTGHHIQQTGWVERSSESYCLLTYSACISHYATYRKRPQMMHSDSRRRNNWAAPRDKQTIQHWHGAFQQRAPPDCKFTHGEKRNKTQSPETLPRHWLTHIWETGCQPRWQKAVERQNK